MLRKNEFGIMLTLLLISMLMLTFNVRSVNAEKNFASTLGVKAGDWMKYNITIISTSSPAPWPRGAKLEFQNVEGTALTAKMTTYMSDGTEQTQIFTIDIATGRVNPETFLGWVIPADSKPGDPVYVAGPGGTGPAILAGEATRMYAEVSRTVVYATISRTSYGRTDQLIIYWDKQTGVLVEASGTSGGTTLTVKAIETNMWQAGIGGLPLWIVGAVIAIVAVATVPITVFWVKQRRISTKLEAVPSEPIAEVKYCTKCGASIPLDATHCTKCGQKQP